jgi:hypothetical protein
MALSAVDDPPADVRVLAQSADGYGPVGGAERGLVVASLELLLAELAHGIEGQPFQPLALDAQPFGPGLFRDRDVGQPRRCASCEQDLHTTEHRVDPNQPSELPPHLVFGCTRYLLREWRRAWATISARQLRCLSFKPSST